MKAATSTLETADAIARRPQPSLGQHVENKNRSSRSLPVRGQHGNNNNNDCSNRSLPLPAPTGVRQHHRAMDPRGGHSGGASSVAGGSTPATGVGRPLVGRAGGGGGVPRESPPAGTTPSSNRSHPPSQVVSTHNVPSQRRVDRADNGDGGGSSSFPSGMSSAASGKSNGNGNASSSVGSTRSSRPLSNNLRVYGANAVSDSRLLHQSLPDDRSLGFRRPGGDDCAAPSAVAAIASDRRLFRGNSNSRLTRTSKDNGRPALSSTGFSSRCRLDEETLSPLGLPRDASKDAQPPLGTLGCPAVSVPTMSFGGKKKAKMKALQEENDAAKQENARLRAHVQGLERRLAEMERAYSTEAAGKEQQWEQITKSQNAMYQSRIHMLETENLKMKDSIAKMEATNDGLHQKLAERHEMYAILEKDLADLTEGAEAHQSSVNELQRDRDKANRRVKHMQAQLDKRPPAEEAEARVEREKKIKVLEFALAEAVKHIATMHGQQKKDAPAKRGGGGEMRVTGMPWFKEAAKSMRSSFSLVSSSATGATGWSAGSVSSSMASTTNNNNGCCGGPQSISVREVSVCNEKSDQSENGLAKEDLVPTRSTSEASAGEVSGEGDEAIEHPLPQ